MKVHIKHPKLYESYCGITKSKLLRLGSLDQEIYKDFEWCVEIWDNLTKVTCLSCRKNFKHHFGSILNINDMSIIDLTNRQDAQMG